MNSDSVGADKFSSETDDTRFSDHLNGVFPLLQFPADLARRVLTHGSHKAAITGHNGRFSFIGLSFRSWIPWNTHSRHIALGPFGTNRPSRFRSISPPFPAVQFCPATVPRLRTDRLAHAQYTRSGRARRTTLGSGACFALGSTDSVESAQETGRTTARQRSVEECW